MSCVWLVIPPCLAHNDSCVEGVAAAPRPACHLTAQEESPHEDHPPDVPLTSTYARRHADPQLFPPHHRWVSALCGPVRHALWHRTRSPRSGTHPHLSTPSPPAAGLRKHLHPDRVCPPFFVRDHPASPVDGRLYPVPQEAEDPPRHPQSRRSEGVAARATLPQASRDPGDSVCDRCPGLRTLSPSGHRHRLPTDGDPRPPRQGQTRSYGHVVSRPAATPTPLLEALSAQILALSGPPHHRTDHQ